MKQYYRIGDIAIEYEGVPLRRMDELSIFQTEEASADIHCTLKSVVDIDVSCPDGSDSQGHWKSDLEYIRSTPEGRTLYLTDQHKKIELLIEESAAINTRGQSNSDNQHLSAIKEMAENVHYSHKAQLLNVYADNFGVSTILRVLDLPFEVLHFGGVFLHASYIEWEGRAILFTAPKQTGKSTQAALGEKYNHAEIVNGDRALLRKKNNVWHAYGSPYCGTSHICRNRTLPVAAIVILGQAKENRLTRANTLQALQALLDGCSYETWDKSQVMRVMDLAEDLIGSVPFWKLDCLPDESAVRLLEKVL